MIIDKSCDIGVGYADVGQYEDDPQIPQFSSQIMAVVIGATSLGLFVLMVLFRGRRKKA